MEVKREKEVYRKRRKIIIGKKMISKKRNVAKEESYKNGIR